MGSDFSGPEGNFGIVLGQTLKPAEVAAALAEVVVDPAFLQGEFPSRDQAHGVYLGMHEFRGLPVIRRNHAAPLAVAVVAGLQDVDVGIAADRVQDSFQRMGIIDVVIVPEAEPLADGVFRPQLMGSRSVIVMGTIWQSDISAAVVFAPSLQDGTVPIADQQVLCLTSRTHHPLMTDGLHGVRRPLNSVGRGGCDD